MWNRWDVDRMRGIWWSWKLIVLLFFPVSCMRDWVESRMGGLSAAMVGRANDLFVVVMLCCIVGS